MTEPKHNEFHYIIRDAEYDDKYKKLDEAITSAKAGYDSDIIGVYRLVAVIGSPSPDNIPVTLINEPPPKIKKAATKKKGKK